MHEIHPRIAEISDQDPLDQVEFTPITIETVTKDLEQILQDKKNSIEVLWKFQKYAVSSIPEIFFGEPKINELLKKAIIQFFSEHDEIPAFIIVKNTVLNVCELFNVSVGDMIDSEVQTTAEKGFHDSVQKMVDEKNISHIRHWLFWIHSNSEYFSLQIPELTQAQQEKIAPKLLLLAQKGDAATLEHFFDLFHLHDIDTPHDGSVDLSETPRETYEKILFSTREAIAEAALCLDVAAQSGSRQSFDQTLVAMKKGRLLRLPFLAAETLARIGEKYSAKWQKTEEIFSRIEKHFYPTKKPSPLELGQAYVQSVIEQNPRGSVSMYQKESFLTLEFSSKQDYDTFVEKKYGKMQAEKPTAGLYCDSLALLLEDRTVGCAFVLIDARKKTAVKEIFDHERHHAINAVANMDELEQANAQNKREHMVSEKKLKKYGVHLTLEKALAEMDETYPIKQEMYLKVKDEITAFLVAGTYLFEVPRILQSTTYEHIFTFFKNKKIEIEEIRFYIQQVCELLEEVLSHTRRTFEDRAKLAYHIKDVSFERIPDYLERLKKAREIKSPRW